MEKKYEFTGEEKKIGGVTLKRIVALKDFGQVIAGEQGGGEFSMNKKIDVSTDQSNNVYKNKYLGIVLYQNTISCMKSKGDKDTGRKINE